MSKHIIAIDWDRCIWDSDNRRPMDGVRDALDAFHERGWHIIAHSCNSPEFIALMCDQWNLPINSIWDRIGKPVASLYIDDKGYHFVSWSPGEIGNMVDRVITQVKL